MSTLLARIMLGLFMIPLAALWYVTAYVSLHRLGGYYYGGTQFVWAGLATWPFLGGYWLLMWLKSVRWTAWRVGWTLGALPGAVLLVLVPSVLLENVERGFGYFIATAAAPLIWLAATCFIWRETAAERASRIKSAGQGQVLCPVCEYNLKGLTHARCPECGTEFTLDDLFARQPGSAAAELNQ